MKCFALAVAALGLATGPASAATYVGTLTGTITSGVASYNDYSTQPFQQSIIDLIGLPIQIDFMSDVTLNYFDAVNDVTIPKYVVNSVTVTIPIPSPIGVYGSIQSNNPYSITGGGDYTGNAQSGSFIIGGYTFDPDFSQYVSFSFANASQVGGPLTGSGTADAGFYNGRDIDDFYHNVTFVLTSGRVTASGAVPEPASWALMIVGVGAIGGVMRVRRRERPAAPPLPA